MDAVLGGEIGAALAAMLGLMVGSFANVVIHRAPLEGASSFRPLRSFCPSCRRTLTWFENVPVLSWLMLRGRCRTCRSPISWRYPAIELLVGALFLGAWWVSPPVDAEGAVMFAIVAYLAATCAVVSIIDREHLIIPDTITKPGMALGLLVSLAWPALHEGHALFREASPHTSSLIAALGGALAGGGSLWLLGKVGSFFLRKQMEAAGVEDAMGFGDVKWMAHTGTFLGVGSALGAIAQAAFLGAIVGILGKLLARLRGGGEPAPIPFGPFLSIGVLVELAWPGGVWNWLMGVSGAA